MLKDTLFLFLHIYYKLNLNEFLKNHLAYTNSQNLILLLWRCKVVCIKKVFIFINARFFTVINIDFYTISVFFVYLCVLSEKIHAPFMFSILGLTSILF